jgi:hypothetical protein
MQKWLAGPATSVVVSVLACAAPQRGPLTDLEWRYAVLRAVVRHAAASINSERLAFNTLALCPAECLLEQRPHWDRRSIDLVRAELDAVEASGTVGQVFGSTGVPAFCFRLHPRREWALQSWDS